jgi:hypothetical protein
MIEYDITNTINEPPFMFGPEARLIRCVYDYRGPISYLTGTHLSNGVHLFLGARPNFVIETATNPIHHHITTLTGNSVSYAKVFNTKRFVIEYRRHNKEVFLQQRFPQWNFVGYSNENFPIIELTLT